MDTEVRPAGLKEDLLLWSALRIWVVWVDADQQLVYPDMYGMCVYTNEMLRPDLLRGIVSRFVDQQPATQAAQLAYLASALALQEIPRRVLQQEEIDRLCLKAIEASSITRCALPELLIIADSKVSCYSRQVSEPNVRMQASRSMATSFVR